MEEAENSENGPIPKDDDLSNSPAKSCALCGCSTPAVRCDRCSSQIFCLSCDDMYHRHPKRRLHLRKAVDSIWNSAKSPRLRRRTDLPGDPSKIPIPPPRSKKRDRHTVGGRMFLKPSHELGSFGHSKMFDLRSITPPSKDVFAGHKTPTSIEGTYENETEFPAPGIENIAKGNDIYENENVPMNPGGNIDNSNSMGRAPWNLPRTNISSPIQVSIPSSSPEMMTNGQSFGYPLKPQSRSITDIAGTQANPIGHHPYHFPHYPYMHPPIHPPYSHSMAHLNCAQCLSSSWSNLMSPHPSPYFHPMPWGSANPNLARGHPPPPGTNGHLKHSHGNIPSYPDPNFHFPYPGTAMYGNGSPVVDPNFAKDLQQQAIEVSKVRKSPSGSRHTPSVENMETSPDITDEVNATKADDSSTQGGMKQDIKDAEEEVPQIPEPPTQPWSCAHCTYINPPGIHVCQVCCKTSFGTKASTQPEHQNEARSLESRNSDSSMELVNLDAVSQSPDFVRQPQKAEGSIGEDSLENEDIPEETPPETLPEPSIMLTTETQTFTTTKSTDVQTQNLLCKSIASSTDSIFRRQEISVQTETETENTTKHCSVATDPMISSQSMESLMSGVSAPPYHNRRAGWGRGTSFSTQSLCDRGRSRSPIPRSLSEAHSFVRDSSLPPDEAMHSWSQAWLMSDPMYYKPHNPLGYRQTPVKEDYYDGTWGSMDKLNRRVKNKQGKKLEASQIPKFHRSLDDLKAEKNQDVIHSRELQFLQTVKEAERCGFSLEDLHVAYLHCGRENPVFWLEDNWSSMIKNVIALAAKYGEDNEENDVGVITAAEAKQSLHIHRGDIWDAVTECIENRQRKILELTVRGNFTQKQIADTLKNNEGNVELAYADLLRASSKRHKFILSPGLSEDSEASYNPVDDSMLDHTVGSPPIKAGKVDIPTDSKADKKKSDFLTKLSAIRKAQSERRKAREEKEMIREGTTQEVPVAVETGLESLQYEVIKSPQSDEASHPEPSAEELHEDIELELAEAELELDVPLKNLSEKKEQSEDNVPEDYDTNWVESQGEWIEEYSDEQWDEEGDGQWVSLQKKYQKMEKEFEKEAREMAALWEKEELEDDVFEEEPKEALHQTPESEAERLQHETDEKFQQWVKVNLEKSLSEPEENEINEQAVTPRLGLTDTPLSKSVEFDEHIICESPLQHYPTKFDLSSKTDPDWVQLEVSEEIQASISPAAQEYEENAGYEEKEVEVIVNKENRESDLCELDNSDGEWEKIDFENELLERKEAERITEIDYQEKLLSHSLTDEIEKNFEENAFGESIPVVQDTLEKESNAISPISESVTQSDSRVNTMNERKYDNLIEDKTPEVSIPKAPVRRKSKLNTAAIEEALNNQKSNDEVLKPNLDVPPALPLKKKDKSPESNIVKDIYAVPEKHKPKVEEDRLKLSPEKSKSEFKASDLASEEQRALPDTPAPSKPPRVNLSPSSGIETAADNKGSSNIGFSKDASPATSLSNESDSNCFADSESDPEIKIIRQKYMHRKATKYENEEEDLFEEDCLASKHEDLDSPSALREEVELQSGAGKVFDFNPELPIPIGIRGSRVVEIDELEAPKAFREGTARPLQLFKVTKQSSTEMSPEVVNTEKNKDIDTMVSGIVKAYEEHVSDVPAPAILSEQSSVPTVGESDRHDVHYVGPISEAQIDLSYPIELDYYNIGAFEHVQDRKKVQESSDIFPMASDFPSENDDIPVQEENIEEPVQPPFHEQPVKKEEEELTFNEGEDAFAAADYFFGRYNEVTVAKPKKKTPTVKTNKLPASTMSKVMSTSDMKGALIPKTPQMEKSASPVMMSSSVAPEITPGAKPQNITPCSIPRLEEKIVTPPAEPEYLSFAEDYFFGSYNEVVVPKKVKKKTLPAVPKSKLPEKPKMAETASVTKPVPASQPESEIVLSEEIQTITSTSQSTPTTPALHHAGSTTSLYYDANAQIGDIYYLAESQQQQEFVDNTELQLTNNDRKLDTKMKCVHFVDPQPAIVPPPRRNRPKPSESNRSSVSSYASVADEFMFQQYDVSPQMNVLDKKKLPPYSEDFKLNQVCDPSDLSSEPLLQPNEQCEGAASSEISMHISKEPSNLVGEPFDLIEIQKLSDELKGSELSNSDKVQDFLDRHSTPTPDSFNFSKNDTAVMSEKSCDTESLKSQKPSEDIPTSEFPRIISTDGLIGKSITSEDTLIVSDDTSVGEGQRHLEDFPSSEATSFCQEKGLSRNDMQSEDLLTSSEDNLTIHGNEMLPKVCLEKSVDDKSKEASDNFPDYTAHKTENEVYSESTLFSEDKTISDSYIREVASTSLLGNRSQAEQAICDMEYQSEERQEDDYLVHIDEEFEDGLRLVEETENLINEFCDIYPPGIFDITSSNEIQNLNTQNNKQESTYDSEHEWKLNEERYNSLNAGFIENKLYKSKFGPDNITTDTKDSLIIDTKGSISENSEVSDISPEIITSSELADISEISELVFESSEENVEIENKCESFYVESLTSGIDSRTEDYMDQSLTTEIKNIAQNSTIESLTSEIENIIESNIVSQLTPAGTDIHVIQPLSVLCQTAASTLEYEAPCFQNISFDSIQPDQNEGELLDVSNDASDESLVTSTRSSVSTQIAVLSDTQMQDLVDELDYHLDTKTPVEIVSDECSMPPNITSTYEGEIINNENIGDEIPTLKIADESIENKEECIEFQDSGMDDNNYNETKDSDGPVSYIESSEEANVEQTEEENNEDQDMELSSRELKDDNLRDFCEESPELDVDSYNETKDLDGLPSYLEDSEEVNVEQTEEEHEDTEIDLYSHELKDDILKTLCDESSEIDVDNYNEPKDSTGLRSYFEDFKEANFEKIEEEDKDKEMDLYSHEIKEGENLRTFYDEPSAFDVDYYSKTKDSDGLTSYIEYSEEPTVEQTEEENKMKEVNISHSEFKEDGNVSPFCDESALEEENNEEPCLSLMSHFYDEWFENVKTSEKVSIMHQDVRSIYASYYDYDESSPSNSGSVSENEDFPVLNKSEVSASLCTSDKLPGYEDITLSVEEDMGHKLLEPEDNKVIDLEVPMPTDIESCGEVPHQITNMDITDYCYESKKSEENAEVITSSFNLSKEILAQSDINDSLEIPGSGEKYFEEKIFTTSKSCQTDDSFEEDLFFDSFDDPSIDPSFLFLPVMKKELLEPVKVEMGVQCHLITSDVIGPSGNRMDMLKSEVKTDKSVLIQDQEIIVADNIFEDPMEVIEDNTCDEKLLLTNVIIKSSEDSSFEISEDSDSDLFLEPHSSYDELGENGSRSKTHFLYTEVDSGFSSGSDSGKRSSKPAFYAKESTVQSEAVDAAHANRTADHQLEDVPSSAVEDEPAHEISEESSLNATKGGADICNFEQNRTNICPRKETNSASLSQNKQDDNTYSKISDAVENEEFLMEDILQRAVTPIAIQRVPSFGDLKFIDVETDLNEQIIGTVVHVETDLNEQIVGTVVHAETCTTPTVEYFLGPLPTSVLSEISPDNNDCFVEALELLDACATAVEKNILENSSSAPTTDSHDLDLKSDSSVDLEDFSEGTLSSFHEPEEDLLTESMSEYFALPDVEGKAFTEQQNKETESSNIAFDLDVSPILKTSSVLTHQDAGIGTSLTLSQTLEKQLVEDVPKISLTSDGVHIQPSKEVIEEQSDELNKHVSVEKDDKSTVLLNLEVHQDAVSQNEVVDELEKIGSHDTHMTSLMIGPNSFKENENTCNASEFEESFYTETVPEYSFPSNTENILKSSLPVSSERIDIFQDEVIAERPKTYFDSDNNVPFSLVTSNKGGIQQEIATSPSASIIDESLYLESLCEYSNPEISVDINSEKLTESEKVDTKIRSSKITFDDDIPATEIDSAASRDRIGKVPKPIEANKKESKITKSTMSENVSESFETLKKSSLQMESSQIIPEVDDSLYIETIPDYFPPETVTIKSEKSEIISQKLSVSEDIREEHPSVTSASNVIHVFNEESSINVIHDPPFGDETEISETSSDNFEELESFDIPKVTSYKSDIPTVPSDIVRYLYYDDSIEFEGDLSICEDSNNSAHFTEPMQEFGSVSCDRSIESTKKDSKEPRMKESDLLKTVSGTASDSEKFHEPSHSELVDSRHDLVLHDLPSSDSDTSVEYQSIRTFSSENEHFESVYSESTEQWFDIDTSKSFPVYEESEDIPDSENVPESESNTETKSLTKDDGDLPCIPELILRQGTKDDFPVAKIDSDEVTDISTHFTMTEDDSDKFSDIESDISLNDFEEECGFSVEKIMNENYEIDKIAPGEENQDSIEHELQIIGDRENANQSNILLDRNANESELIFHQECTAPVDQQKEQQMQDITPSRDVNGNVTECQTGIQMIENVETPLNITDASCQQLEIEVNTIQSNDDILPPTTPFEVDTNSSYASSCESEFTEVSQTEESCYVSQAMESDYWLDASNGSLTETEDLEFLPLEENGSNALNLSTSQNNIPKEDAVLISASESKQSTSSSEIQTLMSEHCFEMEHVHRPVMGTLDSTGAVITDTGVHSQELLSSVTEVCITDDARFITTNVSERTESKLEVKEDFGVGVVGTDAGSDDKNKASVYSETVKEPIVKIKDELSKEVFASDALEQDVISQEASRKLYETKEIDFDDFPKYVGVMPSVVSEVSETERMLNFGTNEEISVTLDRGVCFEAEADSVIQIKPDSNSERTSITSDLNSVAFIEAEDIHVNDNLDDSERSSVIQKEDSFSFAKFGYLFKEAQISDSQIKVFEEKNDSSLNLELNSQSKIPGDKEIFFSDSTTSTEAKIEPGKTYTVESVREETHISELEEIDTSFQSLSNQTSSDLEDSVIHSEANLELVESLEENIPTMGQVTSLLYPDSNDKQFIEDTEVFCKPAKPVDSDIKKKDEISTFTSQESLVTKDFTAREVSENVDKDSLVLDRLMTLPDELIKTDQSICEGKEMDRPDNLVKPLVFEEKIVKIDQGIKKENQREVETHSEVRENTNKDELTDVSYLSLSDESGSWHDEETEEASIEDFIDDHLEENHNNIPEIRGGELLCRKESLSKEIFDAELGETIREGDKEIKKMDSLPERENITSDFHAVATNDVAGIYHNEPKETIKICKETTKTLEQSTIKIETDQISVKDTITGSMSDSIKETTENLIHQVSSVIESSTYSENDSSHFYSICDDADRISVITSDEEFIDVPSHFTVTEGSDAWSDVESDISIQTDKFEQYSLPTMKDKTPIRNDGGCNLQNEDAFSIKGNFLSEAEKLDEEDQFTFSFKGDFTSEVEIHEGYQSNDKAEIEAKSKTLKSTISADEFEQHSFSMVKDKTPIVSADDYNLIDECIYSFKGNLSVVGEKVPDEDRDKEKDFEKNKIECQMPQTATDFKDVYETLPSTEKLQSIPLSPLLDSPQLSRSENLVLPESSTDAVKDIQITSATEAQIQTAMDVVKDTDIAIEKESTVTQIQTAVHVVKEPDISIEKEVISTQIQSAVDVLKETDIAIEKESTVTQIQTAVDVVKETDISIEKEVISTQIQSAVDVLKETDIAIENEATSTQIQTAVNVVQDADIAIEKEAIPTQIRTEETDVAIKKDFLQNEGVNEGCMVADFAQESKKQVFEITENETKSDEVLKERESKKFSDIEIEKSEQSSCSGFKSVSKDDDSENLSDIESEIYTELEDSFGKLEVSRQHSESFETASNESESEKSIFREIENSERSEDSSKTKDKLKGEKAEQYTTSAFQTASKEDHSEESYHKESECYYKQEEHFDKRGKSEHEDLVIESVSKEDSNLGSEIEIESYDRDAESKLMEIKSLEQSSDIVIEKIPEETSLVDSKRILSISVADIVEASELHTKTDETTEILLLEHFADIKSLSEQVADVETITTFEPDTAVLKIHEETADASLRLEKTDDSDYWLEAETEYSISEFEDDAISLSIKETEVSDHSGGKRILYATASQLSNETAAGISATFYTDTEYSDQISDTCADISLQGGTTDNSDKWSDIEGDAAIDAALYGTVQTTEIDKELSMYGLSDDLKEDERSSKSNQGIELVEDLSHTDFKLTSIATESNFAVCDELVTLPKPEIEEKVREQSHISHSVENEQSDDVKRRLSDTLDTSEKSLNPVSGNYTQQLSELAVSNISTGMSDDEFTDVSPLDATVEESDKWSDISDEASFDEIQSDSKSSLQRDSSVCIKEVISSNDAATLSTLKKHDTDFDKTELNLNNKPQLPSVVTVSDDSISIRGDENKHELKTNICEIEKAAVSGDICVESSQDLQEDVLNPITDIANISPVEDADTTSIIYEQLPPLDSIQEDIADAISLDFFIVNKDRLEESSEMAIETDIMNEDQIMDMGNLSLSPADGNEEFQNDEGNYEDDEYLEDADEFDPNVEENEMELGEEDYPGAGLPYILNDDELVYPLQYEDWIEESFDLKEYGIESAFSGSEADVHGFGINDEYDDIQRAIDYNISNFDEAIDNVLEDQNLTTESFKTLSNNTPTQSKITEKEHDSWSTADADSIEDDMSEHDNIISKIDELLAEDYSYDNIDYYGEEESGQITGKEECYRIESQTESVTNENIGIIDIKASYSSVEDDADFKLLIKSEQVENDVDQNVVGILSKPSIIEDNKDSGDYIQSDAAADAHLLEPDTAEAELQSETDIAKKQLQAMSDTVSVSDYSFKASPKANILELDSAFSTIRDEGSETFSFPKCSSENVTADFTVRDFNVSENYSELDTTITQPHDILKVGGTSMSTTETTIPIPLDSLPSSSNDDQKIHTISDSNQKKTELHSSHEVSGEYQASYKTTTSDENIQLKHTFIAEDKTLKLNVDISQGLSPSSKSDSALPLSEACVEEEMSENKNYIPHKPKEHTEKLLAEEPAEEIQKAVKTLPSDTVTKEVVEMNASTEESSVDIKPDIPLKKKHAADEKQLEEYRRQSLSLSEAHSDCLQKTTSKEAAETEPKPDIPKKAKRKSVHKVETAPGGEKLTKTEAPSLPPKTRRDSSSESISSSVFLSSSSESLSCYESASLKDFPSDNAEDSENVPEVPSRKAKSSSLRIRKREASIEDTSSPLSRKRGGSIEDSSLSLSRKREPSIEDTSFSLSRKRGASIEDTSLSLSRKREPSIEDTSFTVSRKRGASIEDTSLSLSRKREPSIEDTSFSLTRKREASIEDTSFSLSRKREASIEDTSSSSSISRSSSSRCSYDLPPKESMDLCRKRTSIDERMIKLQNAGKCVSREAAFIAAKLIEMQFDEEDALLASRQCSSIYHAVKFLTQLCELCCCRFPINSMASMVHCTHRVCKECLKAHFTSLIYDRSVFTLLCPICNKPDITDQNIQEYFNHLEMMLRNILDTNAYELFQRKLRDEVLTKDPNFHWCSQCSSGFIASPRLKKLYCPDCSAITCASCHQTWELEHEGVHCERFQQWKDMHTPEPPPAGTVKFLTDRGITCPSCGLLYEQACGGCMMYKCSHCSCEFCGFCSKPCKRGKDCGNKSCELRGVHAHHIYSCLFYLRDKDVSELQMLLDEESVTYLTIPPKDQIVKSRCQVREQKHIHGSITEDRCSRDIVPYCAGLCRTHYYEYLAELLRKNKINALSIMSTEDLQFMLRKSRYPVPEKVKGESKEEYYDRLTEVVSSTLT